MTSNVQRYMGLNEKLDFRADDSIEKAKLLEDSASDNERQQSPRIKRQKLLRFGYLPTLILIVSLVFNAVFLRQIIVLDARMFGCPSKYTGLSRDYPITYSTTENENDTRVDEYWESLDTSAVVVALDHEYTDSHGLARSVPFVWDDEKGIYHIKALHQLHCLKLIRKNVLEPGKYSTPEEVKPHILHCLNTLRQDIMCAADDTLMPSENRPHAIGDKQVLQCRNWDALISWAREPEHHSCYEVVSEYAPVSHRLERYGFCPENSPHYETMKAYFEKWGHKPMFEEGVNVDYQSVAQKYSV
ncbi:hypothetical protein HYFRA_00001579 [Hymenoscyphus fraxineus]|uniref:Uncharacterized protein n=1 Tax=Hymenoscyphus fraxineus TaxID=746836 RepID=A0A9N9PXT3_9HELO|nr:hypothetical protein HYFRA_00001579 [Hymenoscyphus fraxineus]